MKDNVKVWLVLLPVVLVLIGTGILFYYLEKYRKGMDSKDPSLDKNYKSSVALSITVVLLILVLFGITVWGGVSIKTEYVSVLTRLHDISYTGDDDWIIQMAKEGEAIHDYGEPLKIIPERTKERLLEERRPVQLRPPQEDDMEEERRTPQRDEGVIVDLPQRSRREDVDIYDITFDFPNTVTDEEYDTFVEQNRDFFS